jgi:hypothetical protein
MKYYYIDNATNSMGGTYGGCFDSNYNVCVKNIPIGMSSGEFSSGGRWGKYQLKGLGQL